MGFEGSGEGQAELRISLMPRFYSGLACPQGRDPSPHTMLGMWSLWLPLGVPEALGTPIRSFEIQMIE